jgi:hypothetical protein
MTLLIRWILFTPSCRKFVVFTATSHYIAASIIYASGSSKKMSYISGCERLLSKTYGQASIKRWCSIL